MTGVYIHIPYCLKKCRYCDFCSVPKDGTALLYTEALKKEIQLSRDRLPFVGPIPSLFFGGGTPTALPAAELCSVIETVRSVYGLAPEAECTVECNPGTASLADLIALRRAGANRLSLGLQSAENRLLQRIGRIHTFETFLEAYEKARQAGFTNINVDLMHGLPGQSADDYLSTLKTVCDLAPQHISAYALILEKGTPLYKSVLAGEEFLPSEDETADMEDLGIAYLEERGYKRYEVSNFAREGFACAHNLLYWNNKPYLGFGVAAHSSAPGKGEWLRWANTESIPTYLKRIAKGKLPTAEKLTLDKKEEMFETVMLGLRKTEGISRKEFLERFGVTLEKAYPDAYLEVQSNGWWQDSPERIALNRRGLDMLNTALVYFR